MKPCRSPYCECEAGACTHPGCYDARHEHVNSPAPLDLRMKYVGVCALLARLSGRPGIDSFDRASIEQALNDAANALGTHRVVKTTRGFAFEFTA